MHLVIIYITIFAGIILEGEMVMLSSVIAAHKGNLNLWIVMFIGFSGTLASDWGYFFLGRYRGTRWLRKRPKMQQKAAVIHQRIHKNLMPVLLSYRFLYGLRAITPFVLGTSEIKTRKFLIYSTGATLVWCLFYGILGYSLGEFLRIWLGHVEKVEFYVMGLLILIAVIIYLVRRIRKNREGVPDSLTI